MTTDPESLQSPDTLRALQQKNADLGDENRMLREELLRLRNAISALKDLQDSLREITPESDPHALVDRILSLGLEAVDFAENGSLLLVDEETDELAFVSVQGPLQEALNGFRLAPGEGIAGWVVANQVPLLVPDVRHEPRWSPTVDQTTGFRTTSLICVPLIHQGRVRGALEVVNTQSGNFFNEEDLDVMLLFARLAVEALILAE